MIQFAGSAAPPSFFPWLLRRHFPGVIQAMGRAALVFLLAASAFSFGSIRQKPFHLDPPLRQDFLSLLGKAKDFHSAFERGDRQALRKEAEQTRKIIQDLHIRILSVPHFQQRIHSHRLLRSLEEQLAVIPLQKKDASRGQRRRVKKFFNSFFELAYVYDLKKEVKDQIFYCPKDKSAWFQSGGKPKNPVSPGYKNCGRRLL